ncbi:MAG: F0F1 ATP synthase subunit gamma [Thermodesulfobacteriota bacterium]|nr:F0F1 ATP synthase subunit gamma [Thermodesulfobacteriota bacterium]
METIERLNRKLSSYGDLRDIVSTMKSLSAASIHQYEKAVHSLEEYQRTVELGLHIVLRESEIPAARQPRKDERLAAVIFGTDYGLCGRFNEEITEYALQRMDSMVANPERNILVVGMRAAELLEQAGQPVNKTENLPGTANQITALVQDLLIQIDHWRDNPGVEWLYLFHNRPGGRSSYRPSSLHLLPLHMKRFHRIEEKAWPSRNLPTYTMEQKALLSSLLRQYFFISLFRTCAESQAAEYGSRLAAMQAAERNMNERIDEVNGQYRRARQEAITTELLDVVAGFEAVSGENL